MAVEVESLLLVRAVHLQAHVKDQLQQQEPSGHSGNQTAAAAASHQPQQPD